MAGIWMAMLVVLAPPSDATVVRSPQQLRAAVSSALREEAIASSEKHDAAVRQLVQLYQELSRDTKMVRNDRLQLAGVVRNRLNKVSEKLVKQGQAPLNVNAPAEQGVLGQQIGQVAGGGGLLGGTQPKDYGQDLVDLIQDTIAPSTWEANGGSGVIRYYGQQRVLVIRQTDDVHGELGGLIQQLQK